MNRFILCAALVLGVTSTSARAGVVLRPVTWAGELREAAGPVNRQVSAIFVVKDGGTTVSQIEEATFDVTEGNVIVDLLVSDADDLTLEVFINGDLLGPAPLRTTWPSAVVVDVAASADLADSAGSIGGVTTPLTKAALATAGQAPFPIGNVVGFPSAFLDGDQGLAFSPDTATFTFVDGVLSVKNSSITASQLGSIAAVDLAASAVTTAKIANKTIVSSDFGATLGVEKLADNAITAAHIGTAETKTIIYRVVEGCTEPAGSLRLSSTCTYTAGATCPIGSLSGRRACDGSCLPGSTSKCPNVPFGALVFK